MKSVVGVGGLDVESEDFAFPLSDGEGKGSVVTEDILEDVL